MDDKLNDGHDRQDNCIKDQSEQQLKKMLERKVRRTAKDLLEMERLSEEIERNEACQQKSWTNRDTCEIEALLKEYESLRTESLNTVTNRSQIIVLGLAVIGAVYAGSMQIEDTVKDSNLVTLLFSGAIPIVTLIVLILWVGEAMRMKRVSEFLAGDVEAKINRKFGRLVLTLEQCLNTGILPRDERRGPSIIIFILLTANALLSPLIGLHLSGRNYAIIGTDPISALWIPWIIIGIVVGFILIHHKRFVGDKISTTTMQQGR